MSSWAFDEWDNWRRANESRATVTAPCRMDLNFERLGRGQCRCRNDRTGEDTLLSNGCPNNHILERDEASVRPLPTSAVERWGEARRLEPLHHVHAGRREGVDVVRVRVRTNQGDFGEPVAGQDRMIAQ